MKSNEGKSVRAVTADEAAVAVKPVTADSDSAARTKKTSGDTEELTLASLLAVPTLNKTNLTFIVSFT